jgi:hypothetical protein
LTRQSNDAMASDIRDLNMAYLLLVRRYARESIDEASIRLGVPKEDLAQVADLDMTAIQSLAAGSMMMFRPRFSLPVQSAAQIARTLARDARTSPNN